MITLALVQLSTSHGAPLDLWRMTNASTPIAAIVSIVSRRLSPLFTLDCATANVIVSADRRLAAVSKLSRVRVESSKNTLHTVLPRSAGTFGLGRRLTSAMWSVRSRMRWIPSMPSSSIDNSERLSGVAVSAGGAHEISTPSMRATTDS